MSVDLASIDTKWHKGRKTVLGRLQQNMLFQSIIRHQMFYEGELYSEEHKRKFKTEKAGFQVVKDPKDKSKLVLSINGQLIGEWFKEQFKSCSHLYEKALCRLKIEKESDNKS